MGCKSFEQAVRIACMVLNASFETSYTRIHELVQSVVRRVLLWTEPVVLLINHIGIIELLRVF